MLRISGYATTHTEDSVFIFSGQTFISSDFFNSHYYWKKSNIAQYKDNVWTSAGHLKNARIAHGAIVVQEVTMIIGGVRGGSGSR